MTLSDLPFAMEMTRKAGWNQTQADWRRFLDLQPDGCFLAELDDTPVGTTTTCALGSVGWIAMVLVDPKTRGKGVGTALMRRAIEYLEGLRIPTIRLDATPMGQPIYERLGFVAEYTLARMGGVLAPGPDVPCAIRLALAEDLPAISRFDQSITATDRSRLLERLFEEMPQSIRVVEKDGRIDGYCGWHPGANAWQIGPCLVASNATGGALLDDARSRLAGKQVFLDIPMNNQAAMDRASAAGLEDQRHLLRMVRGEPLKDTPANLWASSGPEKG